MRCNTHTHTRLTALCPGLPGWAGIRKVKPIWILLEQETVSGSGISWAICKSADRSRHITMPAPHHSVFYRPDALPATQPTVSKHWRPKHRRPLRWDVSITKNKSRNIFLSARCSIQCSRKLSMLSILYVFLHFIIIYMYWPSVLWHCWLGDRKGIRPVKNWVVGSWRCYLSGARCRLAYGLADATTTHCFLLQ